VSIEFWVVRVLMHAGPKSGPMRLGEEHEKDVPANVRERIDRGELACIPPDWCIAEAVAGPFAPADQEAAHEAQQRLIADNPGQDFRVIMNADGV
jgi:hypothetical protein